MPEMAGIAQAERLAILDDVGDDQYFRMGRQLEITQQPSVQRNTPKQKVSTKFYG